jgi:hypothetical protein
MFYPKLVRTRLHSVSLDCDFNSFFKAKKLGASSKVWSKFLKLRIYGFFTFVEIQTKKLITNVISFELYVLQADLFQSEIEIFTDSLKVILH